MPHQVLYLTYDGLTDQLGESQILPYLIGLSDDFGYQMHLLSFEKEEKFIGGKDKIQTLCDSHQISWYPQRFSNKIPLVSKWLDLNRFQSVAKKIVQEHSIKLVHARSYVSADVALQIQRKFNIPWIFDMRGFWVDERVEGGIWNLTNPLYRFVYNAYRKKEALFFQHADHIVSLTKAGESAIAEKFNRRTGVSVIPCAADKEIFYHLSEETRETAKRNENLEGYKVLCYLGSIGTWYPLREMLILFKSLIERDDQLLFFFYTAENSKTILTEAENLGLPLEKIRIEFVRREDLREKLALVDYGICFMRNGYSRKATSPVKFGEMQSMGIPMIVNNGIGDMEEQIESCNGGISLDLMDIGLDQIRPLEMIKHLENINREQLSRCASKVFDLSKAISSYSLIYKKLGIDE